jgi:4'-phosphopantetheinyl transferase
MRLLAGTLSADEKRRAEKFYFERDRERYIAGRGLLRLILASYTGIEPPDLQFSYGLYGKPALAAARDTGTLQFNLAHSQGLALYALTREREIGIDIEQVRPIADLEQLAGRFFSARENAILRSLGPDEKQEAFFRYWVHKEAYLKARGIGLAEVPLDRIDVSSAIEGPMSLPVGSGDFQDEHPWFHQELRPAPGYVAALAVEGVGWQLECWQWQQ